MWVKAYSFPQGRQRAFLTDDQVREIRREHKAGKRGKANAWKYKVSAAHYNAIGRGAHRGGVR